MPYYGEYLPKSELVHAQYYKGRCRNATEARWDERRQTFTHFRTKFNSTFLEDIAHPEDEDTYDVFYPFHVLNPQPEREIPLRDSPAPIYSIAQKVAWNKRHAALEELTKLSEELDLYKHDFTSTASETPQDQGSDSTSSNE